MILQFKLILKGTFKQSVKAIPNTLVTTVQNSNQVRL